MKQITNFATAGIGCNQQARPHKPTVRRIDRRDTGKETFRIPRGEGTLPSSAPDDVSRTTWREYDARRSPNGFGCPDSNRNKRPQHRGRNPENNRKRIALAALLGALLVLAGIGIWKHLQPSGIDEVTGGWFYDQDSTAIQEAIDHEVEDGYFNMSINTSVPVSEGTALIGIKNIPENKFDCIVTVTLGDGTEIYKSGGLTPGSELKHVTLNQDLPTGDYEAIALFEIYEQDEAHTKVGQTASKITLRVQ